MANYAIKANPAIRPAGPVTEADITNIRECFAQGLGVRDTARKLGLSQAQVTGAKSKHGLTSTPPAAHQDPSGAAEAFATKARRERHGRREKWQKIVDKLLDDLDADLNAKGRTVTTILRGMGGIESEELVSKLPARDLRERLAAVNLGETQIQKIDALEDDGGLARGQSLLDRIFEDLGAKEITIRPGMVTQ